MGRRWIKDEYVLRKRAESFLPKHIPSHAIIGVECDPYDGDDGGPSYWVYFDYGYIVPTMGCHTVHEDTLADLKSVIKDVELWDDDPDIECREVVGKCPRCHGKLYRCRYLTNDREHGEYFAECLECDEDFFECEVERDYGPIIYTESMMFKNGGNKNG